MGGSIGGRHDNYFTSLLHTVILTKLDAVFPINPITKHEVHQIAYLEDVMPGSRKISRREILIHGGITAAGLTLLPSQLLAQLAPEKYL